MSSPQPNDHFTQARLNRDHAEWLLASRANDNTALQWAATAAFYSALHALTAYLLQRGVQVTDHRSRVIALTDPTNGVPRQIVRTYRVLEARSRGARYMLWSFTPQNIRNLLDRQLAAIASFTGM
jgi:hypothetical protein